MAYGAYYGAYGSAYEYREASQEQGTVLGDWRNKGREEPLLKSGGG